MTLFSENLRVMGREGEKQAMSLCMALGMSVVDVTENTAWQAKEVDLLTRHKGQTFHVEVKTDRYISKTKNFNFELLRLYHLDSNQRMGWSHFSHAQTFMVWDTINTMYVFMVGDLRRTKDRFMQATRPNNNALRMVVSDDHCTTINLLIPLAELDYQLWVWDAGNWVKGVR